MIRRLTTFALVLSLLGCATPAAQLSPPDAAPTTVASSVPPDSATGAAAQLMTLLTIYAELRGLLGIVRPAIAGDDKLDEDLREAIAARALHQLELHICDRAGKPIEILRLRVAYHEGGGGAWILDDADVRGRLREALADVRPLDDAASARLVVSLTRPGFFSRFVPLQGPRPRVADGAVIDLGRLAGTPDSETHGEAEVRTHVAP